MRVESPEEYQKRIRKHSRSRAEIVRGTPCPICGEPGMEVHHIIPIRYGGSYGRYNLMAACKGKCHSRLNKLSNNWCRVHRSKYVSFTPQQQSRICRSYILSCISYAKTLREKRMRSKRDAEINTKGALTV